MPSHKHNVNVAMWTTEGVSISVNGRTGIAGVATEPIQPTGGNQAHSIFPRFMTLAYIMKL